MKSPSASASNASRRAFCGVELSPVLKSACTRDASCSILLWALRSPRLRAFEATCGTVERPCFARVSAKEGSTL